MSEGTTNGGDERELTKGDHKIADLLGLTPEEVEAAISDPLGYAGDNPYLVLNKYLHTGAVVVYEGKEHNLRVGFMRGVAVREEFPYVRMGIGSTGTCVGRDVRWIPERELVPAFALMEGELVQKLNVSQVALSMGRAAINSVGPDTVVNNLSKKLIDTDDWWSMTVAETLAYTGTNPRTLMCKYAFSGGVFVHELPIDSTLTASMMNGIGGRGIVGTADEYVLDLVRLGDLRKKVYCTYDINNKNLVPVFALIEKALVDRTVGEDTFLPIALAMGEAALNSLPLG